MHQRHVRTELLFHFPFVFIRFYDNAIRIARLLAEFLNGGVQLLLRFLQGLDALQQPGVALSLGFELRRHFVGHGCLGRRAVPFKLLQVALERLQELVTVLVFQHLLLFGEEERLPFLVLGKSRNAQEGQYHAHYFSKHS